MNDEEVTNDELVVESTEQEPVPSEPIVLPPQESVGDISNWVDRDFTTPSGRVVIETDQTDPGDEIIAE